MDRGPRRFRTIAALSHPKEGERGDDRGCYSENRGAWALCDGASDCFDGGGWASVLAPALCLRDDPELALAAARRRYAAGRHAPRDWLESAARDRGSFSTALSVRASASGRVLEVNAIGDTVFFLLDGFSPRLSFPLGDPADFNSTPALVDACAGYSPAFEHLTVSLGTLRRPRFALLTDALAARALAEQASNREELWRFLLGCDGAAFAVWAQIEIEAGRMRRDDLTLLAAG